MVVILGLDWLISIVVIWFAIIWGSEPVEADKQVQSYQNQIKTPLEDKKTQIKWSNRVYNVQVFKDRVNKTHQNNGTLQPKHDNTESLNIIFGKDNEKVRI